MVSVPAAIISTDSATKSQINRVYWPRSASGLSIVSEVMRNPIDWVASEDI